ncbi:GNAT family acetyltransferase [Sporocytophaga myxococcoides]|uniref:GNAT family acetyltransferase n=1 Tax=Sporocytophaga myxococcoides TaxID=153721 RepID=A0A098LCI5_9BACT|nr:GNAT family N-acetyltransferase [Sporocytophaga myxococcoides]GAL84716.1 GNAT family acetyltransferase [Sporocytophaga myxococcoides]
MTDNIHFVQADLSDSKQFEDFWSLLNEYASDIMGGGAALPIERKEQLRMQLPEVRNSYILIAYINDQPAGLANCFTSFSTFNAAPLLNIHDFVVKESFRNKGIALAMLNQIEKYAREKKYCKLTLEVLEGNKRARHLYNTFGFSSYELDPMLGKAIFLDKKLK